MKIAVEHLLVGMSVDLEGDPFADDDPESLETSKHIMFECELQPVAFSLRETLDCQLVGFDGWDWCGFPVGHKVNVKRFDRETYDACKDEVAEFVATYGGSSR